jgi:hypothetical protein
MGWLLLYGNSNLDGERLGAVSGEALSQQSKTQVELLGMV